MKTKLVIIALLLPLVAWAATLTIEVPTNDVPRVQEAFGVILGKPGPATPADIQKAIQQWLVESTKSYERYKAQTQYSPPPLEMATPAPGGAVAVAAAKASPTPKEKKK